MKIPKSKFNNLGVYQIIYPEALLFGYRGNRYPIIGEYCKIKVEPRYIPTRVHDKENAYEGEPLPYTFEELPTEAELFLKKMAGF